MNGAINASLMSSRASRVLTGLFLIVVLVHAVASSADFTSKTLTKDNNNDDNKILSREEKERRSVAQAQGLPNSEIQVLCDLLNSTILASVDPLNTSRTRDCGDWATRACAYNATEGAWGYLNSEGGVNCKRNNQGFPAGCISCRNLDNALHVTYVGFATGLVGNLTIPNSLFTGLPYLTELFIKGNANLTSPFPEGLSNLKNLTYLTIDKVGFVGTLPRGFGQLTKLTGTEIAYLTNMQPPWPAFDYNPNLRQLYMGGCASINNGTSPYWINSTTFPNLTVAGLYNNGFTGPFPDLSGNKIEYYDVSSNYFSGPIPSWMVTTDTVALELSSCFLRGTAFDIDLCPNGINIDTILLDDAFDLSNIKSFSCLQKLTRLNLYSTNMPSLPRGIDHITSLVDVNIGYSTSLVNISRDLEALCPSIGLAALRAGDSTSMVNGSIPECFGQLKSLNMLNLGLPFYTGTIPAGLRDAPIATFYAPRAEFSGCFPLNVTTLSTCDTSSSRFYCGCDAPLICKAKSCIACPPQANCSSNTVEYTSISSVVINASLAVNGSLFVNNVMNISVSSNANVSVQGNLVLGGSQLHIGPQSIISLTGNLTVSNTTLDLTTSNTSTLVVQGCVNVSNSSIIIQAPSNITSSSFEVTTPIEVRSLSCSASVSAFGVNVAGLGACKTVNGTELSIVKSRLVVAITLKELKEDGCGLTDSASSRPDNSVCAFPVVLLLITAFHRIL